MLELIEVGYTKKPKGIEGYLKLHIEEGYVEDVSKARVIFLDLDGSQVPFIIEKFIVDSQLMIKLDEVDTPQEASLYCAKKIFLHSNEVTQIVTKKAEQAFLVGFTVMDSEKVSRGIIEAILEYPNQVMAEVNNGTKEPFLLPIHQDQIISLDESQKLIVMELPEGIDDLN